MENRISEPRRRANSRRDIEGQTDLSTNFLGHLPWTLNSDFSPIYSFICQVAKGTLALGSPQRHMHPVEDFTALINSNESNSSTLIELDRVDSLTENQVHPMNFLRMRTNVTSKMKLSAPQIIQHGFSCSFEDEDAVNNHEKEEDYMNVSQILEVYMEDTNVKKPVDLLKLTGYKDLYKKVREMFNIEVEYLQDSKWILVYEDKGCGRLFNLGDFPWLEFTDHATKIYIHERDQLGISTKME